ncbi:hypothetical protein KEM55_001435 [Ascosphaera atra]|nr:hypothetical protein KEM55_001435 [Ascosphaera atra]
MNSTNSTLHVANLHPSVTPAHLTAAFIPFGPIVDVSIPKAPEASARAKQQQQQQQQQGGGVPAHRGWGYVEFETEQDAREALDNMDGSELFGKILKVTVARGAKAEEEVREGLGSRTAIWEQEGYLARHAVSQEDRQALEESERVKEGQGATGEDAEDPVQALRRMDVAGPQLE